MNDIFIASLNKYISIFILCIVDKDLQLDNSHHVIKCENAFFETLGYVENKEKHFKI